MAESDVSNPLSLGGKGNDEFFCRARRACKDGEHTAACQSRRVLAEEVYAWICEVRPNRERISRAFPHFLEWYTAQLAGVTIRDSNGEYVGTTGGVVRDAVANIAVHRMTPYIGDFISAYEWARKTFSDSPAKLGSDGVWRLDPLGRPLG